ncbi:MAG: hypothetical protein ACOCQS_01645 [Bacillota bacterium]
MRELSNGETLTLANILKMEKDGLAVSRTVKALVTDEKLTQLTESTILATENRIKGIQQFINENTNMEGIN